MSLIPRSLVGRTAVFVTLIVMANHILWFSVVRPMVFNRYVQADQVMHPAGVLRLYVELEWAAFALLTSAAGIYVIFFWLRRQLASVVQAARVMGSGQKPEALPDGGPSEIRQLSRGFNQLALNLEALESERRLMLVGISHDLATPLTRLRLALELLTMRGSPGDTQGMLQDLEEMSAILQQFTDYAKTGREEPPVAGDLGALAAEVCSRYRAVGRNIRMQLIPGPTFMFRPLAMRRLITNLLDNAIRYGGQDVEIHLERTDERIVLSVLDRGPGIRSVDPNALIRPFAREDPSRGSHTGAGLGLAIVERIAIAHGGGLHLHNRADGGLAAVVTLAAPGSSPSGRQPRLSSARSFPAVS